MTYEEYLAYETYLRSLYVEYKSCPWWAVFTKSNLAREMDRILPYFELGVCKFVIPTLPTN